MTGTMRSIHPSFLPKLRSGDTVRFVSPASTPDRDAVLRRAEVLERWGLRVDYGVHAFYRTGVDFC